MDHRTEQLADGVWRIEAGPFVNTYLLANDGHTDADGLTLVDSGTRSAGPRIVRSIRMAGLDPRGLTDVLLTHWHRDHNGSAARLAASSAAPRIRVGLGDLAAVRGEDPRPARRAASADITPLGRLLARVNAPGPAVAGATGLADGEQLETAGRTQVVASPGHTAGHVAYWLPKRGVLLAGDAVVTVLWVSRGPGPVRCARSHEAASLRRLADLEPGIVAVGHGPPLTCRAAARLARLAARAGAVDTPENGGTLR